MWLARRRWLLYAVGAIPYFAVVGWVNTQVAEGPAIALTVLFWGGLVVDVVASMVRRVIRKRHGKLEALKQSGFKVTHEVKAGFARLYFDAEHQELAILDETGPIQRVKYAQLDTWKYYIDPNRKLTYIVTTLDAARPFIQWRGGVFDDQLKGEAFLARVNAIVNA